MQKFRAVVYITVNSTEPVVGVDVRDELDKVLANLDGAAEPEIVEFVEVTELKKREYMSEYPLTYESKEIVLPGDVAECLFTLSSDGIQKGETITVAGTSGNSVVAISGKGYSPARFKLIRRRK